MTLLRLGEVDRGSRRSASCDPRYHLSGDSQADGSPRRGSNPRHPELEAGALPAELRGVTTGVRYSLPLAITEYAALATSASRTQVLR